MKYEMETPRMGEQMEKKMKKRNGRKRCIRFRAPHSRNPALDGSHAQGSAMFGSLVRPYMMDLAIYSQGSCQSQPTINATKSVLWDLETLAAAEKTNPEGLGLRAVSSSCRSLDELKRVLGVHHIILTRGLLEEHAGNCLGCCTTLLGSSRGRGT